MNNLLKLDEENLIIENNIFDYFKIKNPELKTTAKVLNLEPKLIEFIDPTECLKNIQLMRSILKSYNWMNFISHITTFDEQIFLNLLSISNNLTMSSKGRNTTIYYDYCFLQEFTDYLKTVPIINEYLNSLFINPSKMIELCNKSPFALSFFISNESINKKSIIHILLNNLEPNDTNFYAFQPNDKNILKSHIENLFIPLLKDLTKKELKSVLNVYNISYSKNANLFKFVNSDLFISQMTDFLINNISRGDSFIEFQLKNFNYFNSEIDIKNKTKLSDIKFSTLVQEISNNEKSKTFFYTYISDLNLSFYNPFKDKIFKNIPHIIYNEINSDEYFNFLENDYPNHIFDILKIVPSKTKTYQDFILNKKLIDLSLNKFENRNIIISKDDFALMINIYDFEKIKSIMEENVNELSYSKFYEQYLTPTFLNNDLHIKIPIRNKLDNSEIRNVIEKIHDNYCEDNNYLTNYKNKIQDILCSLFEKDDLIIRILNNAINFNNIDTSKFMIENFLNFFQIDINNDKNFLNIFKKPLFLNNIDDRNVIDLNLQKIQKQLWDLRSEPFTKEMLFLLTKKWKSNCEDNHLIIYEKELLEKCLSFSYIKTNIEIKKYKL